jgi:hypothetical protein
MANDERSSGRGRLCDQLGGKELWDAARRLQSHFGAKP